ncbi:MAG TPA: PHB depolymerase family esterase, partial [Chloroflexota bacterium]
MDEQMFSGMAEATRLTREGKVLEATALIQRTLGVPSPHVTPVMTPPPADTVDAAYRVVEDLGTAGRQESEPTGIGPAIPRAGSASPSRDEAGQFLVGTYTNAAGARSYKLYIPSGYRGQEVPLLVMLHGCTQTADDFAVGTRMNLVAEEQTFIVVYPEQARRANGGRCWNWFEASHQTRDGGEPSIIAETTRHIMAGYRIDPAQVYVAGMSAGGAMAAVMAATYPDLFAAVGIHSGVAPGAARTLQEAFRAMQGDNAGKPPERTRESRESGARAVPVIVFHGDRDKTVNPRNADRVMKQWATGGSAEGELRVTTYPCQVPGGYAYTRTMYRDASDEVVMEKWIVHEAG